MTLQIHLFGQPLLLLDGHPVRFAAPPRVLPLLAYLLLDRRQAVERQQAAFACGLTMQRPQPAPTCAVTYTSSSVPSRRHRPVGLATVRRHQPRLECEG